MPNQYNTLPIRERLQRGGILNENGCVLWQGSLDNSGYGVVFTGGREWKVHVVSYLIFVAGWIEPGLIIMHSCNVRRCYAPEHLSAGTHADNAAHREASGNTARGERSGRAIVTEAQVREIRARAAAIRGRAGRRKADGSSPMSLRMLADEYGLTWPGLQGILYGKSWRHVT